MFDAWRNLNLLNCQTQTQLIGTTWPMKVNKMLMEILAVPVLPGLGLRRALSCHSITQARRH